MRTILKYFPQLTDLQQHQIAALYDLYADWNTKINVISRKDIDNLYEHHVLHSLAIAKAIQFRPGTQILDFGTGGGFPGIPLAIMFPECQFRLIDGTGKKIRVATEVAQAVGLKNCQPVHMRGEEEKGKFDFVVSRAVMPLPDLLKIIRRKIAGIHQMVNQQGCLSFKDMIQEFMGFHGGSFLSGNQGNVLLGPSGIVHADCAFFSHSLQQSNNCLASPASCRFQCCRDLSHGLRSMIPQTFHDLPFSFRYLYRH